MPEYRRFIAYFYEYIDGKKQKNSGFTKVELRDGMWRILLRLTTRIRPEPPIQVYGFVRKPGYQLGLLLGTIRPVRDIAEEWAFRAGAPVGRAGYRLEDLAGLWIESGDGRRFLTVWDDEETDPEKFVPESAEEDTGEERPGEETERAPVEEDTGEERLGERSERAPVEEDIGEKQSGEESKRTPVGEDTGTEWPEEEPGQPPVEEGMPKAESELQSVGGGVPPEYSPDRTEFRPSAEEAGAGVEPNLEREMAAEGLPESAGPEQMSPPGCEAERPDQEEAGCPPRKPEHAEPAPEVEEAGCPAQEPEHAKPAPEVETEEVQNGPQRKRIEELFRKRPGFEPFEDGEIGNCVMILPCDIVSLQQDDWNVGRSSFLQHGFYRYRHLLLGRDSAGDYLLGVPGFQNPQENYMAQIFGFDRFKRAETRSCGRVFGYWCRRLEQSG